MSNERVSVKVDSLTAIGDAIREKKGESKYKYLDFDLDESMYYDESLTLSHASRTMSVTVSAYYKVPFIYHKGEELPSELNLLISSRDGISKKVSFVLGYQMANGEYRYYLNSGGNPMSPYNYDFRGILNTSFINYGLEDDIINLIFGCSFTRIEDFEYYLSTTYELDELNPETNYKPSEMGEKIKSLMVIPEEGLNISGDCQNKFTYNQWNWFIEKFGDKIKTIDISGANNMFSNSTNLQNIPFKLNFKQQKDVALNSLFSQCQKLREPPEISNVLVGSIGYMFSNIAYLRYIPDQFSDNLDFSYFTTYAYCQCNSIFSGCASLREVPSFFKRIKAIGTSSSYQPYNYAFNSCYVLDEVLDIPVSNATLTSNMFNYMFSYTYRLKRIKFEVNENETPKTAKWKSQTIDLSQYVGYSTDTSSSLFTGYNSGLTTDTWIKNAETYQELKDNPDAYVSFSQYTKDGKTIAPQYYSRYTKASAIETINSLPDCSAYLATAGGTNTIKFNQYSGRDTDEGGIASLSAAEIAVASSKGWTVSLV